MYKVLVNEELIRDIQGMYLYKYLNRLIVRKGQPNITLSCDFGTFMFMSSDIEDKLERLCKELFGVICYIVWEDTSKNPLRCSY